MGVPTLTDLTGFAGAVALVLILVEVLKRTWNPTPANRDRFLPLISIAVGVIVVLFALLGLGTLDQASIFQGIITGIFAGVSASGTYDLISGTVAPAPE